MNIYQYAQHVGSLLKKKNMTLSVCESCTGGMLGAVLTSVTGSSAYFRGGIIAYANRVKTDVVGVQKKIITRYGAVSRAVARDLAQNVRHRLHTDIGLSITGIAGPSGGTKKKPVGRVYVGVAAGNRVKVREFTFKGTRKQIRQQSCLRALQMLTTHSAHSHTNKQ